jgi:serine/threonine protein kinase
MPLRGEAVDRPTYLQLTQINKGSSEVHTGYHSVFGQNVVQKTVPAAVLLKDSVARNEPQVLLALEHPSIPRIYEAQHEPTRPGYITFTMENVGDFDASKVVLGHRRRPSIGEWVKTANQLLSALEYLHVSHDLVQRDIKPDNIRLSVTMTKAWLIDFNYAAFLEKDGTVIGVQTPFAYMAPEVPVTSRYTICSELYSLGLVLYEIISGTYLAGGLTEEKQEQRITSGKRAFPDSHFKRWSPEIPRGVRSVIAKAVRSDPAERWQSAAEMRTALGRCVYIDWRQDATHADRWEGTWPSNRLHSQRIAVEVTTQLVARGVNRGRRRVRARYLPTTDWRRLPGLSDRFADTDAELSHFFEDVERRLASIRPAA